MQHCRAGNQEADAGRNSIDYEQGLTLDEPLIILQRMQRVQACKHMYLLRPTVQQREQA